MFCITPKAGSAHYEVRVSSSKQTDGWEPPRRKIYFVADVSEPSKIHLASGPVFSFVGDVSELTPVRVTLWDRPGSDKVDGSSSFIHVSADGSEPHVSIDISLEPAQFDETLKDLRDGMEVALNLSERHDYMFGKEPRVIKFHRPDWHRDGDSIDWRDDLQKAIAIRHVTINSKFGDAEPQESEPVEDETATRWNELSGTVGAVAQSIAQLEAVTVAAHRRMMSRLIWVIVLLAVIAAAGWLHR